MLQQAATDKENLVGRAQRTGKEIIQKSQRLVQKNSCRKQQTICSKCIILVKTPTLWKEKRKLS